MSLECVANFICCRKTTPALREHFVYISAISNILRQTPEGEDFLIIITKFLVFFFQVSAGLRLLHSHSGTCTNYVTEVGVFKRNMMMIINCVRVFVARRGRGVKLETRKFYITSGGKVYCPLP